MVTWGCMSLPRRHEKKENAPHLDALLRCTRLISLRSNYCPGNQMRPLLSESWERDRLWQVGTAEQHREATSVFPVHEEWVRGASVFCTVRCKVRKSEIQGKWGLRCSEAGGKILWAEPPWLRSLFRRCAQASGMEQTGWGASALHRYLGAERKQLWCGDLHPVKSGRKSSQCQQQGLGAAVRCDKGTSWWFFPWQLISWYSVQLAKRTVGLDIIYSTSHKPGALWNINFRAYT